MLSFMMDTRGKVGVGLGKNDDGGIVVTVVSKGGPAETAGLLVGDVLETIDGRAVPGLSTDAAGTMLCGAVDSLVVVKVRRSTSSVLLAPTTVILKMTRCPRVWRACCRVCVSPRALLSCARVPVPGANES
jgi:C-terminal processing protease CtpA/Prc